MALPVLRKGDKVALVDVSSAVPEERLESSVQSVRDMGLEPVVFPSCSLRHGYFAGTDAQRARDLMEAFLRDDIRGVICIRGGYGAHRVLPLLDLPAIKAHWKPFYGYSDVTALHLAFNNLGLASYQTPMPSTEWYSDDFDPFTRSQVEKALFGGLGLLQNPEGYEAACLRSGSAEGLLVGGNLSLVSVSVGTPWAVDARDRILFLEDVNEAVYRVDNMLTHLRNAGVFKGCRGVILGAWTDCEAEKDGNGLSLKEVFEEVILPEGDMPVLMDLRCGHCLPTLCLPLGSRVRLDADKKTIECLEAPHE